MARILVIDVDQVVRTEIRTFLEQDGFDVVVAADGHAGLEALKAQTFDLVIVDIFMTGMDGLETLRVFRRHAPMVPIIAVSGFTFRDAAMPAPDFLAMAPKLGAACSLAKPLLPQDLLGAVKACLPEYAAQRASETLPGTAPSAMPEPPSAAPIIAPTLTLTDPASACSAPGFAPVSPMDAPVLSNPSPSK
jgi:DNA-binding response OmpR family regulator